MARFVRQRWLRPVLLGAAVVGSVTSPASGLSVPPGFAVTELAAGLRSPTAMAIAGDGRIFVCEQKGTLRVVRDGQLLATPFVTVPVDGQRERGLVGVALHPDFPRTPYVYVYYTASSRRCTTGSAATPPTATVRPRQREGAGRLSALVRDIHNGGALHFGPDGMLYVGVGENGVSTNARAWRRRSASCCGWTRTAASRRQPVYASTSGLAAASGRWGCATRSPLPSTAAARGCSSTTSASALGEIDEIVPGGNTAGRSSRGRQAILPTARRCSPIRTGQRRERLRHRRRRLLRLLGAARRPYSGRDDVPASYSAATSSPILQRLDPAARPAAATW